MNSAEAFISCISDLYAANKTHSQELQYAKKTKKIPCLPLVVGMDTLILRIAWMARNDIFEFRVGILSFSILKFFFPEFI